MSLKKLFLTTSAIALFAGPALADGGPAPDSPPPPPPPPQERPYTPPPAFEPASDIWYASLHGGAVWMDDFEYLSAGNLFFAEMDPGWAVGGALGYRYESDFRTEFEFTWRHNEGDLFNLLFPGVQDFEVSAQNLMLNLLYDFDTGFGVIPYVGAGIGGARVRLADNTDEADGWSFAYQFIGGFTVPMPNTAMAFFADYRYLRTAGLKVEDVQDNDEYKSHTVMGGIRFSF